MDRCKLLYLPIEIVERELEGKLLVAAEALSRGYSVLIGQFSRLPAYAVRIGFGFYFYKAHTDHRAEKLFIPLREAGVQCGALDEEGLVFPSLEYFAQTRVGKGVSFRYLDSIMTWGEVQKEFLAGRYPEFSGKMVSVGNPRIDLLRAPYRERFHEKAREIRRALGDFILVNTNFGPGNYAADYNMGFEENLKTCGFGKSPEEEAYTKACVEYYGSMFRHYVAMVKELAAAISPVSVVVRPHPSENHDRWREALKDIPKVKIIFEGSVNNWLAASRCMIHTGCTTGIEAFLLDTPVLRYNPHYNAAIEAELPNSLSDGYGDVGALIDAVKAVLAGRGATADLESRKRHLATWIANVEGGYSHERIMDTIDSVYREESEGQADFWRAVRPSALRRIGSALKYGVARAKLSMARWAGGGLRISGAKSAGRPIGFSGKPISRTMREFLRMRDSAPGMEFKSRRITKDILLITPGNAPRKAAAPLRG